MWDITFNHADGWFHPYLLFQVPSTTPFTNSITASTLLPQSIFECKCHSCQMEDIPCWHDPAFCLKYTALSQESDLEINPFFFGVSLENLQSGYTVKKCCFLKIIPLISFQSFCLKIVLKHSG